VDPRTSAAALGTSAVVVVAVGLGVSIARTDDGGVRPAADATSTSPSPTASPTASPTPSPSPARPVRDDRRHSDVPGVGRGHGAQHGGRQQPTPTDLPFTGSAPLPATTALGLLLAVAGSWTLVRVPGAPGQVSVIIPADALARLRAPRRATR
jgi:hypothetical protein